MPITDGVLARDNWIFGDSTKDILTDKKAIYRQHFISLLDKCLQFFEYTNLPEEATQRNIERYNILGGGSLWTNVDLPHVYVFHQATGGEPDPYYLPTIGIIANPYLNYSRELRIGTEVVWLWNDSMYYGLRPLISKYAELLTECTISMRFAVINSRTPIIPIADNDAAYEGAKKFIANIVDGKEIGIVLTKAMELYDGLKAITFSTNTGITEIIEATQYILGSFYHDIGLNAAFNMKREALSEHEVNINTDILYPSIDSMLFYRKKGIEEVNRLFGTDITVELSSVWQHNRETDRYTEREIETSIEHELAEAEKFRAEAENEVTMAEVAEKEEAFTEEQAEKGEDTNNEDTRPSN